jgi:hypothetical protein
MEENKEQPNNAGDDKNDREIQLQQENEELTRQVKLREESVSRLETALANKDEEITELSKLHNEAVRKADELGKTLVETVAAYRGMVVAANPGIVDELIKGESVTEVNDSLKRALSLVEKVRQGMEVEMGKTIVPAGAPVRAQPELSGMSARDKIRYGIGGKIKG